LPRVSVCLKSEPDWRRKGAAWYPKSSSSAKIVPPDATTSSRTKELSSAVFGGAIAVWRILALLDERYMHLGCDLLEGVWPFAGYK
jgi:hypothetical protein